MMPGTDMDEVGEFTRLSIPGNACIHCGAVMRKSLVCAGCGWVDPLTKRVEDRDE